MDAMVTAKVPQSSRGFKDRTWSIFLGEWVLVDRRGIEVWEDTNDWDGSGETRKQATLKVRHNQQTLYFLGYDQLKTFLVHYVGAVDIEFIEQDSPKLKTCATCHATRARSEFRREDGRLTDICKVCHRRYYMVERTYGLSPAEFDALLKLCAICGSTERLAVDHDHSTGEVRGMLCANCNSGIGLLKEDERLLLRAAEYLMGMITTRLEVNQDVYVDPQL